MSEKRYFKIEYDEEWYLFDSTTISEQLVKEQAEYGYGVFANSLSPSEVVGLLNKLYEENEQLQKQVESSETTSNATSNYNAFLESKITTLEEENDKIIQKNCIPCELVNLQTREIDNLKEENEQLRRDEQLYAKEILRLKEELKEKEMLKLGGDY